MAILGPRTYKQGEKLTVYITHGAGVEPGLVPDDRVGPGEIHTLPANVAMQLVRCGKGYLTDRPPTPPPAPAVTTYVSAKPVAKPDAAEPNKVKAAESAEAKKPAKS